MKIKLNINGQKTIIKSLNDLTCRQYFTLLEKGTVSVVDYISLFNNSYKGVLETSVNQYTLRIISSFLSDLKPFEYYYDAKKIQDEFVFGGKLIKTKDMQYDTLGIRLIIEEKSKQTQEPHLLALWCLSGILSVDYDSVTVANIYNQLLGEKYMRVMPVAGFFLKNCLLGSRSVKSLLKKLLRW